MAKLDPQVVAHREWLGFVQPIGLVVSAPALVRAGAILDRRDAEGQRLLRECVEERAIKPDDDPEPVLPDFRAFASTVLAWSLSPKAYAGADGSPIPSELEVSLADYGETLSPDLVVRERDPDDGASDWQLLVRELPLGEDLDAVVSASGRLEASAHGRMERLLRETGVPAGLLFNGRVLRLISAPRGESSGWIEFRVSEMVQTAGRPISTAMRLLLGETRLLTLPRQQRLAALLEDSRKFQNEVSEKLAEQVLHALYELQRGFQAAHDASGGELLKRPLAEDPDGVYRALLTVILRLVFLLYSEEREMLPEDETFIRFYSLTGLYERLRADEALYPDTMNQRYSAWAQLLVLFRMVHDGAESGGTRLPARHGALFDPDRSRFLEGRTERAARQVGERLEPPLVPDGTIFRALDQLLVLDGERISYRALDVEQIGSVYETMMGFSLELATGPSVAIKAQKKRGAPTTIDLHELLGQEPGRRAKWLQDHAERKLTPKVAGPVKEASSVQDLHAALAPVTDAAATPDLVPRGAMILQPSQERRRSGSHYTPRTLTEPMVRKALEPILARLGTGDGSPTAEQLLDLKVCDPAMGSGAFLVEACRQLGDALIEAWAVHDERPELPPDEDQVTFARRLVAQRCLYGVDRNPVAVDLAKMSLWLATLAKDHAFTFLDHALEAGDALVGLSRSQIDAFHWDSKAPGFEAVRIRQHLDKVNELREQIREAPEGTLDWDLRDLWDAAQAELLTGRLYGDLVLAAFFSESKAKDREAKRDEFAEEVAEGNAENHRGLIEELRQADQPLVPFHWEIEFPEIFERRNPGFDAIVGNPPFMAGKDVSGNLGAPYLDWLRTAWPDARGQVDLVAFFFRMAYDLLREKGTSGLLATNTIRQGDTRAAGLKRICDARGVIYSAIRRIPWQGAASVVTSAVHIAKGFTPAHIELDGRSVRSITAFLFHQGGNADPERLGANKSFAFSGFYYYGAGFTFDDANSDASPLSRMREIVSSNPDSMSRIHPVIGGKEMLNSPTIETLRYVVDFESMSESEARRWPELMSVLEELVKPEREKCKRERLRKYWWQFGETRPGLRNASRGKKRVLMHPFTSAHLAFAFIPAGVYIASPHVALVFEEDSAFAVLQSRPHELWARFFGSSLKDDLRYTPSDCFESFALPDGWQGNPDLEHAGLTYYEYRAALMVRHDAGLTSTYNRFHDPDEHDPEIEQLRKLHAEMDRVVLDSYGWGDITTDCEFLLDYEPDEADSSRKKRPWRYRWPDEVRDEVLGRLIKLNTNRAAAEKRSGISGQANGGAAAKGRTSAQAEGLF